jgi:hypothetical protein
MKKPTSCDVGWLCATGWPQATPTYVGGTGIATGSSESPLCGVALLAPSLTKGGAGVLLECAPQLESPGHVERAAEAGLPVKFPENLLRVLGLPKAHVDGQPGRAPGGILAQREAVEGNLHQHLLGLQQLRSSARNLASTNPPLLPVGHEEVLLENQLHRLVGGIDDLHLLEESGVLFRKPGSKREAHHFARRQPMVPELATHGENPVHFWGGTVSDVLEHAASADRHERAPHIASILPQEGRREYVDRSAFSTQKRPVADPEDRLREPVLANRQVVLDSPHHLFTGAAPIVGPRLAGHLHRFGGGELGGLGEVRQVGNGLGHAPEERHHRLTRVGPLEMPLQATAGRNRFRVREEAHALAERLLEARELLVYLHADRPAGHRDLRGIGVGHASGLPLGRIRRGGEPGSLLLGRGLAGRDRLRCGSGPRRRSTASHQNGGDNHQYGTQHAYLLSLGFSLYHIEI